MSRLKCIVGSIIVLVAVVAAGIGMYYAVTLNRESGSNEDHADDSGPIIHYYLFASTTDGRILNLDTHTKQYESVVMENSPIQCFEYSYKHQALFYATAEPNEPIKLFSGEYELSMNYSAGWTKTAMAIDSFHEKLYVLDGLAEKLYAIDTINGSYFVSLANLDKPKDVIFYDERRVMYILQESSVLVVDMESGTIHHSNELSVRAFAVDRINDDIYVATNESIVVTRLHNDIRFKYDRRYVLRMTVFEGQLWYLGEPRNGSEKSLNICFNGCKTVETVQIAGEQTSSLSDIKGYYFLEVPMEG